MRDRRVDLLNLAHIGAAGASCGSDVPPSVSWSDTAHDYTMTFDTGTRRQRIDVAHVGSRAAERFAASWKRVPRMFSAPRIARGYGGVVDLDATNRHAKRDARHRKDRSQRRSRERRMEALGASLLAGSVHNRRPPRSGARDMA